MRPKPKWKRSTKAQTPRHSRGRLPPCDGEKPRHGSLWSGEYFFVSFCRFESARGVLSAKIGRARANLCGKYTINERNDQFSSERKSILTTVLPRVVHFHRARSVIFVGRRQPSLKNGGLSRKRRGLLRETSLVFRKSAQLFSKRCFEHVKSGGNKTPKKRSFTKECASLLPYSSLRAIGLTQVGSATRRRAHFNPRAATSRREFGPRSYLNPQKKERIFTLTIRTFP